MAPSKPISEETLADILKQLEDFVVAETEVFATSIKSKLTTLRSDVGKSPHERGIQELKKPFADLSREDDMPHGDAVSRKMQQIVSNTQGASPPSPRSPSATPDQLDVEDMFDSVTPLHSAQNGRVSHLEHHAAGIPGQPTGSVNVAFNCSPDDEFEDTKPTNSARIGFVSEAGCKSEEEDVQVFEARHSAVSAESFKPMTFQLRRCFMNPKREPSQVATTRNTHLMSEFYVSTEDEEEQTRGCCANVSGLFPLHPDSKTATSLDFLSMLLITYDFIMLPLQAFSKDENDSESLIAEVARIYWTFSIFVKFLTGYLDKHGRCVNDYRLIAARYATGWLPFDAVMAGVDWSTLVFSTDGVRILLMLRLLRLLRLVRLIALARLFGTFIALHIRAEGISIAFELVKIVIAILVLTHLMGCGWYFVGTLNSSNSWISSRDLEEEGLYYRYITCFHVALQQLSGGSCMNLRSAEETTYAAAVTFLCFVFSAMAISDLTQFMTQLHLLGAGQKEQLVTLQRFLFDRSVPRSLTNRILDTANVYIQETKSTPPEESVELLKNISIPLLTELHYTVHSPTLQENPFFFGYTQKNPSGMRHVCHSAVRSILYASGDVLFSVGEVCTNPCVYFVTKGTLAYQTEGETREFTPADRVTINEPALWLDGWQQLGALRAKTSSFVFALKGNEAVEAMSQFRTTVFYPMVYAKQFVEEMNTSLPQEITDIASDFMDLDSLCNEVFEGGLLKNISKAGMNVNLRLSALATRMSRRGN